MDDEVIVWSIVGVAAIVAVYLVCNLIYKHNAESGERTKLVKTTKIEACRTITDEAMRTLCIVEGGTK